MYIPAHYLKINPFRMIPLCDMTYGQITALIFNNSKINHQYITKIYKIINVWNFTGIFYIAHTLIWTMHMQNNNNQSLIYSRVFIKPNHRRWQDGNWKEHLMGHLLFVVRLCYISWFVNATLCHSNSTYNGCRWLIFSQTIKGVSS